MADSTRRLIGIRWSPWTITARLALEHHGLPYRFVDYTPYLGEPMLRAKLGFPRRRVTVPVLFDGAVVVTESRAIVLHADGRGSESPLLPEERAETIAEWETDVHAACQTLRGRVTRATMSDVGAINDELEPLFPRPVRRFLIPVAKRSVRYVHDKYGSKIEGIESVRQRTRPVLSRARDALSERPYLVGDTFSYADITLIGLLQGILPDTRFGDAGANKTAVWTDAVLANEYGPLLEWRDRTLERHALPRASS